MNSQHVETLIVGAGQAGLTTGYQLKRRGHACLIVDGNQRIGDNWRQQWDTLRLYTPAKYDGLPGLAVPGDSAGTSRERTRSGTIWSATRSTLTCRCVRTPESTGWRRGRVAGTSRSSATMRSPATTL